MTLLISPHSTTRSPVLVKEFWISSTVLPEARKPISSAKDKAVISGFSCSILSNILLRYKLNRIGDTGES